MAKKKLSHDQKRKLKLKKKSERSKKHESMAYHGKKYQAPEFAPILYRTEIGIFESYVICDRSLIDEDIEAAIERLIGMMRAGPLPALPEVDEIATIEDGDDEAEQDFIIATIRRNWLIYAESKPLPAKDDLIGVLRTLLSSIETRRSMALNPQGYLRFLEDFMKQMGVSVTLMDAKESNL